VKVGDLVKHAVYGLGIITNQHSVKSFNKGETTAQVHFVMSPQHYIEHLWLFELEAV
tara:strand:- start:697 stop:867 length:171 start_codon:yes stop_codon:yes gene_type:complete